MLTRQTYSHIIVLGKFPSGRVLDVIDLELERKSRNMTQAHLAADSHLSRSYIAQLENGYCTPSIKSAKKLAKALCIDWKDFFDDESEV